ncbi:MAG: DUF1232 domain-containing protein [Bacteroidetes bacterium]|nr:DUF1232 domain-containing protein [Bacteroidota bacterium]MBL6962405.1 DUF1232 domain-containing protein [Bacteroidota bacterium]
MSDRENDFLDRLRIRINYWLENKGADSEFAKHLKWIPDIFEFMCKLSLDREVKIEDKANLAVSISYFLSPFDLFPEALAGTIGYSDDLVLAAITLNYAFTDLDENIVTKHWKQEEDVHKIIAAVLADAEKMVGKEMWGNLLDLINH